MVEDVGIEAVPSREYERSAVAVATVDGPAGRLRVRRRYEALPRHNDVVDRPAIDSNDEYVDRPDAVHVHTRLYAVDDGAYVLDDHDTWTPEEVSVLGDADAFLAACRAHHVGDVGRVYRRAIPQQ